jgi:hypothetical protein
MAQKILLRRGPVTNIAAVASSQGELLLVTGSVGALSGPFITMTGTAGTGTSTIVGKIYEGSTAPSIASYSPLTGAPFYATGNKTLYRLNHAGNQALDLSGNLEGTTVSSMTITTLTNTTLNGGTANFSGNITGSNLLLSGNANINGNIVLGGSITIGDQDTDNISLGGEFTSNLIPDADNTYAVGSPSRRWKIYGVDSSISGSFSGSFEGSFTNGVDLFTIAGGGDGSGTDLIESGDTLTFTNASTHGFSFAITNNQVSLATPQDLRNTASPSFAGATAGNITVGVSTDNTITTSTGNLTLDSSGGTLVVNDSLDLNGTADISGNVTLSGNSQTVTHTGTGNLTISSTSGNTLIEGTVFNGNDVTIPGNLTVQGTTTTIDSTTVNIGDNIIVLNAAGTVADGGINVIDTIGTVGTGSLLWNATNDYWYAGVSGSTHYRLATYDSASPTANSIQKVDANGRLTASTISDNGTTVTIGGNLTANTITANTAIVAAGLTGVIDTSSRVIFRDGSNRLGALATADSNIEMSTVIGYKADGTLVASSLIDGGTF